MLDCQPLKTKYFSQKQLLSSPRSGSMRGIHTKQLWIPAQGFLQKQQMLLREISILPGSMHSTFLRPFGIHSSVIHTATGQLARDAGHLLQRTSLVGQLQHSKGDTHFEDYVLQLTDTKLKLILIIPFF